MQWPRYVVQLQFSYEREASVVYSVDKSVNAIHIYSIQYIIVCRVCRACALCRLILISVWSLIIEIETEVHRPDGQRLTYGMKQIGGELSSQIGMHLQCFTIWTNTLCNFNKYTLQSAKLDHLHLPQYHSRQQLETVSDELGNYF